MKIATFGFRDVLAYDLSDTSKGALALEQITEISHDGSQESDDIFYEDSIVPAWKIRKTLTGNITVKGDIEEYIYPKYASAVKTDQFFELDHYYLLTFLRLNKRSGVNEMVYSRWVGQFIDRTKETLTASQLNPKEIMLAVAIYGDVNFLQDAYYNATASGTPGPIDATPQGDYDPLFSMICEDSTKTLVAAETHLVATLVNPA